MSDGGLLVGDSPRVQRPFAGVADSSSGPSSIASRVSVVAGLQEALAVLQAPAEVTAAIVADVEQLGVVSMAELTVADCESLRTWSSLRPLQQQRLSQFIASLLA